MMCKECGKDCIYDGWKMKGYCCKLCEWEAELRRRKEQITLNEVKGGES